MNRAPILLFVYNRPEHSRKTIESLLKNDEAKESDLVIYADGPKKPRDEQVNRVREYIHSVSGFKSVKIHEREENIGLANSVISGVSEVLAESGKVIVMEDDIEVSSCFLRYMNEALIKYENNKEVFSITGYSYFAHGNKKLPNTYMASVTSSWTWATWADRWSKFDSTAEGWERLLTDKKYSRAFDHYGWLGFSKMMRDQMERHCIDSWYVRWEYTLFKNKGLCLFPNKPLAKNIGCDGTGTHFNKDYCQNIETDLEEVLPALTDEISETHVTFREINKKFKKDHDEHICGRIKYYAVHPVKLVQRILK